MAASKRFLLAKAAQRKQAVISDRATSRNMPAITKPSLWQRTREAYFGARPYNHKQQLEAQMAAEGVE